jgi:hypothetical protein
LSNFDAFTTVTKLAGMSEKHYFTGDISGSETADLDAPIKGAPPLLSDYAERFNQARIAADSAADKISAPIYQFLGQLCAVGESFDSNLRPFSPIYSSPEGRSFLPEDMSNRDLDALAALAPRVVDPTLKARLCDILWVLRRDYTACAEATKGYLVRAKLNDTSRHWPLALTSYQRAIQLAGALGRGKPLFAETTDAVSAAARDETIDHPGVRNFQLMRLMLRSRLGDPTEFAGRAAALAEVSQLAGKLELAQNYHEIEAEWHKASGDALKEKAARLAAGELGVLAAEKAAQRSAGGALAAAKKLVEAIETLRRAGADATRIKDLRARLTQLQAESRGSLRQSSHKFDITDQVKISREHVANRPLPEALMRLAFGLPPAHPSKIKQEVIDLAKENPLSTFIAAEIIDEKGRTVAHQPGIWTKQGPELEAALEARMFTHAAQYLWGPRTGGFVNPARLQIINDHQPNLEDLLCLVQNNPFIPPDHAEIFLRGLHAGFHGDFIVAVHLLVPQVENSLRYVLEEHGVDVSNLQSDGTQPVKILGALLGMEETKKMLGTALHFEVRGHLIEKTGYDFRNKVAHGFVSEYDCHSNAALSCWWLVLRLSLHFAVTGGQDYKDEETTL